MAGPAAAGTSSTTNVKYDVVDETTHDEPWVRPCSADCEQAPGALDTFELVFAAISEGG